MFRAWKNLKNKYNNSANWKEFVASCLINLDEIYERLEGKTETQQIEILKKALENQTKKTKDLVEVISKQNEQIEELNNENQLLKEQIKDNEEVESVLSGSSGSDISNESVEIAKVIQELEKELLTTKKSTAPKRKELKLWKRMLKIKRNSDKKDAKIKKLEDRVLELETTSKTITLTGLEQREKEVAKTIQEAKDYFKI